MRTRLERLFNAYTNLFAFWVVLFGCIAYWAPEPFLALKGGMNLFFGVTMFGIGVVLEKDDFVRIVKQPLTILIGVCSQFSIMPLGAFAISLAFGFPPELAAGLILTGSAPGAMSSNVLSYIAKADTAYSVSLTTASTLLCPVLTPLLTYLLAGAMMDVSVADMMLDILNMVVVPLGLGFAVRHFFNRFIHKILFVFPALSTTFIVFIGCVVIAANQDRLAAITLPIFAAAMILNAYGLGMGYGVASLARMAPRRRRTLSIEIGMQNAGLGVVLAMNHFGEEAAAPAAIFVFVCIITASVLATLWRNAPEEPPANAD